MTQMKQSAVFMLLVGVFAAVCLNAAEGDSSCTMKTTHQYGFLGGGISWFDDSKLNDRLALSNLPKFKEYAMTISIGGRKDMKRMTMESVITGHFWRDKVSSNQRISLWSGDIFWNGGYNILPSEQSLTLFPYVGLGVGLNTMRLRSDTKTFSGLLTSTDHALFLTQGSVIFNVGLGSDLFLVKPDKTRSMVIGIRAGYSYDLYNAKNWYSDGTTISDLPVLRHNGGFIRLVIGGMGNRKHCEKSPEPSAEKGMKKE
jgi:hypothetical protein